MARWGRCWNFRWAGQGRLFWKGDLSNGVSSRWWRQRGNRDPGPWNFAQDLDFHSEWKGEPCSVLEKRDMIWLIHYQDCSGYCVENRLNWGARAATGGPVRRFFWRDNGAGGGRGEILLIAFWNSHETLVPLRCLWGYCYPVKSLRQNFLFLVIRLLLLSP